MVEGYMPQTSLPFVCSDCLVEFLVHEGGSCSRCKRMFCGEHLFTDPADHSKRFCQSDSPLDSNLRPILSGPLASSLRLRRRIKKEAKSKKA
jgi:hypothetical protein